MVNYMIYACIEEIKIYVAGMPAFKVIFKFWNETWL